jgi:uncharacterized membrane protein (UPF0127 family)
MVKKISIRTVAARSFSLRLRGLMFRSAWPGEWSAVYFPDCSSVHTFFTNLKFDLVFLDANKITTRLVETTRSWRFYFGPPGTQDTLELPFGTIHQLDLKVGDEVSWDEIK